MQTATLPAAVPGEAAPQRIVLPWIGTSAASAACASSAMSCAWKSVSAVADDSVSNPVTMPYLSRFRVAPGTTSPTTVRVDETPPWRTAPSETTRKYLVLWYECHR